MKASTVLRGLNSSHRFNQRRNSIGVWSTEYTVITGQAIVTRRVSEEIIPVLGSVRRYIFPTGGNLKALAGWMTSIFRLWLDLIRGKLVSIYLVCSRSDLGLLRDFPALIAARLGVRVIVHVHGSDIERLLTTRLISPLARWLYRKVTLILPSDHLFVPLQRAGIHNLKLCENFYELLVPPMQRPRKEGPFRILWNSNIMASKGFFTLYRACELLRASDIQVELTVLGTPIADEEMSQSIVQRNVERCLENGTAHFVGPVSPEKANELLNYTDVVALPSRYSSECQPLSIIAAMCAGIPIVVSDIPPLRSTVQDYPAEFVAATSEEAVAEALRRVHSALRAGQSDDSKQRQCEAELARKRFSPERFDRDMTALLTSGIG